jgi:hypothetical protein
VTTPSKLGVTILSIFGLPFLGMGLFAAYSFLSNANQPLLMRVGGAVFASVFAVLGGGIIVASFYGYSLQKKQADMETAHPDSPWLWRDDWAAGRVESKNKASVRGWWIGAALCNMLSLPMFIMTIGQAIQTQDPTYLIPMLFGLAGLLVLFGAIRATLRLKRFGKTYFEMSSLPFVPGGRIAGSIHMQMPIEAAHVIDLNLTCYRKVEIGGGQNRSTQQVSLWEASKNVAAGALARGPLDTTVPVEFHLPADAFQTDHQNQTDQVFWSLKASADVPGVDYADEFEVPVFRTSAASQTAFAGAGDLDSGGQKPVFSSSGFAPPELSDDVPEPAHHKVVVTDSAAGLKFHFRAARNFGRTLLVVVLAAAVSALFYKVLNTHPRPPAFAFGVVGLLDFFLILAVVHTALMGTRITVGNGTISWRQSVLGIGGSHQIQISDVDSIVPTTSLQQASSSGSTLYSIRLKSKGGKDSTLVDDIESREEARWIVAKISERAGLHANTQVEMAQSIYGPPPQPGAVAYRSRITRN